MAMERRPLILFTAYTAAKRTMDKRNMGQDSQGRIGAKERTP